MALKNPDLFARGYQTTTAGKPLNYFQTPGGQGDGVRMILRQADIPLASGNTQIVGLIPFNKGFSLGYGTVFSVDDLDTGATVNISLGYIYNDTVANTTANQSAFLDSATTAQAGGLAKFLSTAGVPFVATGNGWITATFGTAVTGTTGTMSIQGAISYQV